LGKGRCCNPAAAPLAANWDLGLERGSIPGLGGRLGTSARGGCSWAAKVAGEGGGVGGGHGSHRSYSTCDGGEIYFY
jgi:hypothetical protein